MPARTAPDGNNEQDAEAMQVDTRNHGVSAVFGIV